MADTPTNNPLDDRMRSTFAAEHADIERRHAANGSSLPRTRSRWLPMAIAAALVAIAGFAFVANRSSDTAVDVGVAGQLDNPTPLGQGDPEEEATALPDPAAPSCTPSQPGLPRFVLAPDTETPRILRTIPDESAPVDRTLGSNVTMSPTGNCHRSPDGTLWSEVIPSGWIPDDQLANTVTACLASGSQGSTQRGGRIGSPTEGKIQGWAFVDGEDAAFAAPVWEGYRWFDASLVDLDPACAFTTQALPEFEGEVVGPRVAGANLNQCDESINTTTPRFIWGIGADDPDGGLVAHTEPALTAPRTRVVPLDGVVFLSGGCVTSPDLITWIQIVGPTQLEWVSSRYLRQTTTPACLIGEQFGTQTRSGVPLIHVVQPGDTLGSIAQRYDMTLDALLAANVDVDPGALRVNDFLLIDTDLDDSEQIFGPLDGAAIFDLDKVAFAPTGSQEYRWYPAEAVREGERCVNEGPTGPICLTEDIRLIHPQAPEPVWVGTGPTEAQRTGRLVAPLQPRATYDLFEVIVALGDNTFRTGLIDPITTEFTVGSCDNISVADDFQSWPCAAGQSSPLSNSGRAGSAESVADHVHDIRVQDTDGCVRVVIELGIDSAAAGHQAADLVPLIDVTKDIDSTEIRFTKPRRAGQGEPERVDFRSGTVFIGLDDDGQPYVQVLHDFGRSAVTLLENPARVVVDWQPGPTSIGAAPIALQDAILFHNIDFPVTGPAMIQPTAQVIRGFARPFEAQGLWHVFVLDDDGDIGSVPTSVASGSLSTTGWVDGWGAFVMTLPDLPVGDYAVMFGESPPAGGPSFVGSGQRIRVTGADSSPSSPPWAADAFIDYLELDGPILVID